MMIAERIKELRERNRWKQADLAKQLNVTRSSVNAWEMGTSVPSTPVVVDMAKLFKVSTDYILGEDHTATISVEGLDNREVGILVETANMFRKNRRD